jgi:hypothetical protein
MVDDFHCVMRANTDIAQARFGRDIGDGVDQIAILLLLRVAAIPT